MTDMDPKFSANLTWSYSRHMTFHDCRRAYWFEHIATYDRSLEPALKNKLWKLKGLSSTRFLRGSLIHNAISEFLSNLSKGRDMTESELHDHLLQNVEVHRRRARDTIAEYYNGRAVDEEFFDSLRTEGTEQLSMFFRVLWPPLSRLSYAQHEKPERFVIDDTRVGVKVDLVSKSPDGRIFIVDWKTGADDERYESDLQIGVYTMWAAANFSANPSQVTTDLHYLRSGKTVSKILTAEQLAGVKDTIKAEYVEFLNASDRSVNPPNPGRSRCPSCRFATVCDDADLSGMER